MTKKDEIQFLHDLATHNIEKNDNYCRHQVRANTETPEKNICWDHSVQCLSSIHGLVRILSWGMKPTQYNIYSIFGKRCTQLAQNFLSLFL